MYGVKNKDNFTVGLFFFFLFDIYKNLLLIQRWKIFIKKKDMKKKKKIKKKGKGKENKRELVPFFYN